MVHDSEESNKIWYTHNMKEHTPAASELLNYCFSFLLSISCSVAVCQLIINMMMMMMSHFRHNHIRQNGISVAP